MNAKSVFRRPHGSAPQLGALLLGLAVLPARAAQLQALADIRATAESWVRGQMPAGMAGIEVSAAEPDPRLRLAACPAPLVAAAASSAPLAARTVVSVSCREGVRWTVYVPVSVAAQIPVLVLKAPQPRGARLTASDVVRETRRVSGLPAAWLSDPAALGRHTLRYPLSAGAVLAPEALVADVLVHQGEQVTLAANARGIEVRAAGKALEEGHEGARIRVQNLGSLRVVEGVVDADRVIHVTP